MRTLIPLAAIVAALAAEPARSTTPYPADFRTSDAIAYFEAVCLDTAPTFADAPAQLRKLGFEFNDYSRLFERLGDGVLFWVYLDDDSIVCRMLLWPLETPQESLPQFRHLDARGHHLEVEISHFDAEDVIIATVKAPY